MEGASLIPAPESVEGEAGLVITLLGSWDRCGRAVAGGAWVSEGEAGSPLRGRGAVQTRPGDVTVIAEP